jgi:glycosyltransferase involved in cell wall biosynthesis
MKILFLHRPDMTSGGDYVALNGYTAALERMGIEATRRNATEPGDVSGFDFVHLWAACSPDWGLPAAYHAKQQGARLIVTPFWWDRAERQAFYGRPGQDLAEGYTPAVGQTLQLADVLFPVTMSEAGQCWKRAPRAKVWPVPMGVDRPEVTAAEKPDDYVLCIGRIEPHKNQHSLAAACYKLGIHLKLMGAVSDQIYSEHVSRAAHNNVVKMSGAWNREISAYLSRARVHALPSFFENPGLVHMEAAVMGIPAVMGNRGCEPEFFGPGGIYCDPTSVDDIAAAIAEAWERPRGQWATLPTWDEAASVAMEWMEGNV